MTKAEEYCRAYEGWSEGTNNYRLFHESATETNSGPYIIMEDVETCEYYVFETWEDAEKYLKELLKTPQKTYTVCIEEVCSQEFEIEAEDAKEAEAKAIKMYKNSEIILEDANLVEANIAVVKPEDEITSFNTIY